MTQFHKNMSYTGFLRSLEQYGKKFGHCPAWRNLENFFWSLSMEKEIIFQTRCFDMRFHNIVFKVDNTTILLSS